MTENEARIFAQEINGSAYCAGLYYWRVVQRLNKQTIRIYDNRNYWWDQTDYVYGASS